MTVRRLKPDWMPLAVLCATDRDGLSAENAFVLRDIVLAATPLDYQFLPGSFLAFFAGDEEGRGQAARLADDIKYRFAARGVASFETVIEVGPCQVVQDGRGHFAVPPSGETVRRAMRAAIVGTEHA